MEGGDLQLKAGRDRHVLQYVYTHAIYYASNK